jgi:hypothetical protein
MKEVVAHWTPEQWIAVIGAIFAGIASVIASLRAGQKIDEHDARATARARERGEPANPSVTNADRGHLK